MLSGCHCCRGNKTQETKVSRACGKAGGSRCPRRLRWRVTLGRRERLRAIVNSRLPPLLAPGCGFHRNHPPGGHNRDKVIPGY
jgi:hypothetical protein